MIEDIVYEVPTALLADVGLRPGGASGKGAYRCDDPTAVLIPFSQLRGPVIGPGRRGYKVHRLRSALEGIAVGSLLPPVPVFREPSQAVLLDGAHRWAASIACGFGAMPCRVVSLEEAETTYGYPDGQR